MARDDPTRADTPPIATAYASAARSEHLAQELLDRRPRRGAGLVLRELDADALRAVALHAFGRDPDDLALHGDPVRVVHQRQQHEHFLAEPVFARRRDEDAAALRNGMYAAYSAAFSRMFSDSTPGPRERGAGG